MAEAKLIACPFRDSLSFPLVAETGRASLEPDWHKITVS
jgi:hypothetical protein